MRQVVWGVLGTAGILRCTAAGMQKAELCNMYAIAGRNPKKTEEFKERYGFEKTYYSYDELLDDDKIEAVYIPLPNSLHYDWVIKALKKGKHVLCEKPMAPNEDMAREMFRVARDNNVFLMEAFAYQHSAYMQALADEINKGTIGDVRYIETSFITSEHDASNIRMRKDTLGGSLYDLGVYNTSFILRLLGKEAACVNASATFTNEGIDSLTSAVLDYDDGCKAAFTCGMILAKGMNQRIDRFEIHGTKGIIRSGVFEYNLSGRMSYDVISFDAASTDSKIVTMEYDIPDNYSLEVDQLSRCVLGKETPAVTEEFTLANARMVDAVLAKIGY